MSKFFKRLLISLLTISIIFSCSDNNNTNEAEITQEEVSTDSEVIIGDDKIIDGNGHIILTYNLVIEKNNEFNS